jgi:DNA-binding HxlR family transcriptional regulator
MIEGRWKPMIFRRLGESALGFGQLRRAMPGVTAKVLRQQLRQLEANDLVARSAQRRPGIRVAYGLTPHGRTLGPVFEALWMWGRFHLLRLGSAEPDPSRLRGGDSPELSPPVVL